MICFQPPPPPLEKLIPLNRPIPPKIAIGPNPPLTEDFQKSPILPKSWGMGRGGEGSHYVSRSPQVPLVKGPLEICSNATREHPPRIVIPCPKDKKIVQSMIENFRSSYRKSYVEKCS